MGWSLLSDAVIALHLAFTAFVVLGGFLAWRWRDAVFAHLPALAWGCWIELSGRICPLTPLENRLRALAGESGYTGGFIEHYIVPVIYPPALTRHTQWLLVGLLAAINIVAYAGVFVRRRRRPI
jgi:hypothetical protein